MLYKFQRRFVSFFVLLVAIFIFLIPINKFPLHNWDEAWYAQISTNMANNNHSLLFPYWNGGFFFDKPPLYMWFSAPVIKIFGEGEWQMRIVSVVATLVLLFALLKLAEHLFNNSSGFWAAVSFLTFGQVVSRLGAGNLDGLMICLFFISVSVLIKFKSTKGAVLGGVFWGMGVLAKGWIFGGYFGLVAVLYILLVSDLKIKQIIRSLGLYFSIGILVSGWWYLAGAVTFGKLFTSWYLFDPIAGNLTWKNPQFSFNFLSDFVRDIGLWLIPLSCLPLVIKTFNAKEKRLVFWLVSIVFFYVLSLGFLSDKLGWYLLPAYPFVALLVGFASSRLFGISKILSMFMLVPILVAQSFYIPLIDTAIPDKSIVSATVGEALRSYSLKSVVFEGNDYPGVLYYSRLEKLMVTNSTGRKQGEWWVVNQDELEGLLVQSPNTTIVTTNPQKYFKLFITPSIKMLPMGFYMLNNR